MVYKELDVLIKPDGTIDVEGINFPDASCLKYLAEIEKALDMKFNVIKLKPEGKIKCKDKSKIKA